MAENNQKDYKNGKIYCIRNNINDDIYVGSTTQPLCKRMAYHRQDAKKENKMHQTFYSKVNEIGIENFYIELIEDYPCESVEQLRKREGEFIREMGTLNHVIAGRTGKEWLEQNKEKVKEYFKEYHKEYDKANRDNILEYKKEYYEAIKNKISEKISCACGGKYTIWHKLAHERTNKHQLYIQQCNV